MSHRVMQRCFAGKSYWSDVFQGSRSECQTWIKRMARAGRHTCTMTITSRSSDDFKRLNPAE